MGVVGETNKTIFVVWIIAWGLIFIQGRSLNLEEMHGLLSNIYEISISSSAKAALYFLFMEIRKEWILIGCAYNRISFSGAYILL